jgi:alkaline phosphatase D
MTATRAVSRRVVMQGLGGTVALATVGLAGCGVSAPDTAVSFRHGVASGEPTADSVVLWTRVTPLDSTPDTVEVMWEVAADPDFVQVMAAGSTSCGGDTDHTVHVRAGGLRPASTYYYRFHSGDRVSLVGRTRTLPSAGVERVRLGVVSCANYAAGHFAVYREVAAADVDAVVHLGDFIYEHGEAVYDAPETGRRHDPPNGLETLADYRRRYAQYHEDLDTQAILRQHPLLAVWDDHEFANNAWRGGGDGVEEATWARRREAAARAWHEWLPVDAGTDPLRIWRAFAFGDLADLFLLDTRIAGRDEPSAGARFGVDDPARSLLGPEQRAWLHEELRRSAHERATTWRVIGQQVPMVPLAQPFTLPDKWDGYPGERTALFDALARNGVDGTVVLSGDVHSSWANEVAPTLADARAGTGRRLVEFVAPSVTSPFLPAAATEFVAGRVQAANPWVRWLDVERRGWLELDITRAAVQADWYVVGSVRVPDPTVAWAASWKVDTAASTLAVAAGPVTPRPDPPVLAP